jgi:hypothetical protein
MSAPTVIVDIRQESNQKLGACGAQFRDGFPEIQAGARRD